MHESVCSLLSDEIVQELQRCSGTQFDPDVVNAFVQIVDTEGRSLVKNSAINGRKQIQLPIQELVRPTPLRAES